MGLASLATWFTRGVSPLRGAATDRRLRRSEGKIRAHRCRSRRPSGAGRKAAVATKLADGPIEAVRTLRLARHTAVIKARSSHQHAVCHGGSPQPSHFELSSTRGGFRTRSSTPAPGCGSTFDDLHARSSREHLVTCSFRPLCPLSRVRPRRLDSQRSRTSCGDRRSVGVSMSLCLGGLTASDLVPTVTWYLLSWCCSTDPTASSRDNTARHSILWLDGVERSARGCRDDDCSTGPDLEWTSNFFVGSGVAP
jgi:hypothetical protein